MKIIKTESVSEFLARGGKITKYEAVQLKDRKPRQSKPEQEENLAEVIDMSQLPMALKIKYGIR
jgi:hypothetical protein